VARRACDRLIIGPDYDDGSELREKYVEKEQRYLRKRNVEIRRKMRNFGEKIENCATLNFDFIIVIGAKNSKIAPLSPLPRLHPHPPSPPTS